MSRKTAGRAALVASSLHSSVPSTWTKSHRGHQATVHCRSGSFYVLVAGLVLEESPSGRRHCSFHHRSHPAPCNFGLSSATSSEYDHDDPQSHPRLQHSRHEFDGGARSSAADSFCSSTMLPNLDSNSFEFSNNSDCL